MFFTPFSASLYCYSLTELEKQYSCSPQTCSFSLALVVHCGFFLSLHARCPQTETMSLHTYFLFGAASILNSFFSLAFLLCSSLLGMSPDPLCTLPPPPSLTTLSSCACLLASTSLTLLPYLPI